ncbi:MAG: carboxypeptidase-like regulatory domain-containing protein [Muribaculaceae bacterium]|nr:carboxypeptidase-like regulatory domain-containing protein [Muribaculaceae bacterium]
MIKYNFLILFVLLGLLSGSAAVPEDLKGTVVDSDTREPVTGCIVKIKGGFTSTDKKGYFSLSLKQGADSVSFRSLGYEPLTLPIDSVTSTVFLIPKTTQLKDVVVEAPDIYAKGDTLVFNVSRYASAKDNAIIDVIKRLPGIKVEEDGTIKYQGKPINKFYLDGNDFIGGQYGLATNNISHKDVASVEVMEHHQPVKALEGIEFPEEAGINLKLKEDAHGKWVGVAKGEAGAQPFLYNGSIFTMRMAPKIQNIFTLKAGNTGWNPADEINEHDFDDMFSSDYSSSLWKEYISADIVNAPLSEKRTRDNLSWLANSISSWKAGASSMRLILNYMADKLNYNSGVTTDYFSSQIPVFVQKNSQNSTSHNLSAQIYNEINKKGYYLKNKFTLSGVLDKTDSEISGSFNLRQGVRRKNFSANNDLKLVKRNEKKLFTLISRNSFGYRPDRLIIDGEENAMQCIGTTDFRSTTETRFGRFSRFWKYYLHAGIDFNYHNLNTTLSGLGSFDNSGSYDAFLLNIYATPRMDYARNGWRASISVPLKWLNYHIESNHNYINTSPNFSLRRQLTAKSELIGSISYRLSSPKPYMNINSAILSDYRNLLVASNPDKYSQDLGTSLTYKYRNPLKSFFINISCSYFQSRNSVMTNQLFIEDFIVSSYTDYLSKSDYWNIKGGFSKGLGHSKMVCGFDASAGSATAFSMRDFIVTPYSQLSADFKPYLKGSVLRWLSINYEAKYSFSQLRIGDDTSKYHTFHHNIFATLIPKDQLQFTLSAEQYLTRFPEGSLANLVLLDASAVWNVNNKVRLSVTANNLLNRRNYEYVNYGTLSRSEYSFRLRQRNLLASIQYRF